MPYAHEPERFSGVSFCCHQFSLWNSHLTKREIERHSSSTLWQDKAFVMESPTRCSSALQ